MSTATLAALPSVLSRDQIAQYREQGYCIVPSVIPPEHLAILRGACQAAMERLDAEMDREGVTSQGINHKGNRYFSCHPSLVDRELYDFICSPRMLSICRDLLGPDAYIFWEQYVVKAAEKGMPFGWHQDSGYVGAEHPHKPYLTCWCALDDMSEANGTVSILPYDRAGTRVRVDHVLDPATNDWVGYHGSDPGIPVICPAGSIALFSSVTFHRSGLNRSPRLRRSYLIQYSQEPLVRSDGKPWGRTEQILRAGQPVPIVGAA